MSNPYDFTSGYVGAMEASARADKQAMERQQYEEMRGAMIRRGLIKDTPKKKGLLDAFYKNLSEMGDRIVKGFPTFAAPDDSNTGGGRMDTGGMANNVEAPSAPEIPDVAPAIETVADAVTEVAKADGGRVRGIRGYADGSPGAVQQPAVGVQQQESQPQEPEMSEADQLELLKSKSPALALAKEDPKKAEQLYDQVSDFKKLSSTLKEMAAYDFVNGKGSEGLMKATTFINAMQKEGLHEAAKKLVHGDMEGGKKAYMNYGDDRGGDFEIVPRDEIQDDRGIKGGKKKYKVFDVVYKDGSKYTLDVQKLALEALSAKEYLERGDKEFDKDYKREGLRQQDRELGLRAQSNAIAAQDRKDRNDDMMFQRNRKNLDDNFTQIQNNEINYIQTKMDKEVESRIKPFANMATGDEETYKRVVAEAEKNVETKYADELDLRKRAMIAARQSALGALDQGKIVDAKASYDYYYDLFKKQRTVKR